MDRNAAHVLTHHFALAGMQPRANVDSERFNLLSNRTSAANPTGWTVKGGKKAVAGRLDLMAAKASKIASDCGMMLVEEIAPSAVAVALHGLISRCVDTLLHFHRTAARAAGDFPQPGLA